MHLWNSRKKSGIEIRDKRYIRDKRQPYLYMSISYTYKISYTLTDAI